MRRGHARTEGTMVTEGWKTEVRGQNTEIRITNSGVVSGALHGEPQTQIQIQELGFVFANWEEKL